LLGHRNVKRMRRCAVRIGDKTLRRLFFSLEALELLERIVRDADHRCAEFFEVRQPGGVGFRLDGSVRRERLGEEIEHDCFARRRGAQIERLVRAAGDRLKHWDRGRRRAGLRHRRPCREYRSRKQRQNEQRGSLGAHGPQFALRDTIPAGANEGVS